MALTMGVILSNRIDHACRNITRINRRGNTVSLRDTESFRIEKQSAFLAVPTIVAARDNQIDFFNVILTHVTDIQ